MTTSQATTQERADDQLGAAHPLTIGELSARTGLTPEVLRMWEARHGFPVPVRLPSGHRRYAEDDVSAVSRVLRLREGGLRLDQAIAQVRVADETVTEGSLYADLRHRFPQLESYTLKKQTLLALSWAIEDECVALARRPLLFGAFQKQEYYEHADARWRELARVSRGTLVAADFAATSDESLPAKLALPVDSPMLREWIVLCDDPGLTAVLVAWEIPGQEHQADSARMFEAIWSLEPEIVRRASSTAFSIARAAGSGAAAAADAGLASAPMPAPPTQRVATAVFNRMVAYTDGTALRARRPR